MKGKKVGVIEVATIMLMVVLGSAGHTIGQDAKTSYPSMAPADQ